MDARPVYWILCGAGATLLTSAWGSKQVILLPQNVATTIAQANLGLPQGVTNNSLLMKHQPWMEPKSDPFSKATPIEQNVVAPAADKVTTPQPPSFPYVFIGRLLAEEKDAVFLSRNNQIYSVAAGDTLEGIYRIERVGSDTLEITYLPERKKTTYPFDLLAAKPAAQSATVLSQAEVPSAPPVQAQALPEGMAGGIPGKSNGQMTEDMKQTLASPPPPQGEGLNMVGTIPSPALPAGMAGDVPSESNGQVTDDLRQMLAPPPPPEGDVLKMMGATPPPQGDALKMMGITPPQSGQAMPGTSAPAVP